MTTPRITRRTRALLAALAVACPALAACGGDAASTSTTSTSTPVGTPVACASPSGVPGTFHLDAAHSGPLTTAKYGIDENIQASLVYFSMVGGVRNTFVADGVATRTPGATTAPAPPAGAQPAGPPIDLLVVCDALAFASPDGARGFVHSFAQLRLDNQQRQDADPHLGDSSVAFTDSDQSFGGYTIDHAAGVEVAASSGPYFYSVSIFGSAPDMGVAVRLLQSMVRR